MAVSVCMLMCNQFSFNVHFVVAVIDPGRGLEKGLIQPSPLANFFSTTLGVLLALADICRNNLWRLSTLATASASS